MATLDVETMNAIQRARFWAQVETVCCPREHAELRYGEVVAVARSCSRSEDAVDQLAEEFSVRTALSHLHEHGLLTLTGASGLCLGAVGFAVNAAVHDRWDEAGLQTTIGALVMLVGWDLLPRWRHHGQLCPTMQTLQPQPAPTVRYRAGLLSLCLMLAFFSVKFTDAVGDTTSRAGHGCAAIALFVLAMGPSITARGTVWRVSVPALLAVALSALAIGIGDAIWIVEGDAGPVEILASLLALIGGVTFAFSTPHLMRLYGEPPSGDDSSERKAA